MNSCYYGGCEIGCSSYHRRPRGPELPEIEARPKADPTLVSCCWWGDPGSNMFWNSIVLVEFSKCWSHVESCQRFRSFWKLYHNFVLWKNKMMKTDLAFSREFWTLSLSPYQEAGDERWQRRQCAIICVASPWSGTFMFSTMMHVSDLYILVLFLSSMTDVCCFSSKTIP